MELSQEQLTLQCKSKPFHPIFRLPTGKTIWYCSSSLALGCRMPSEETMETLHA